MNNKPKTKLTVSHERLLMRYHDGECSWFTARRAKALLAFSADAKEYLAHLQQLAQVVDSFSHSAVEPVDLWARIEQRIDQEEKTALYLGKRSFSATGATRSSSGFGGLFTFGAPVAAFVVVLSFFLYTGNEIPVTEIGQTVASLSVNSTAVSGVAPESRTVLPVANTAPVSYTDPTVGVQVAPTAQFVRSHDPWEVEWIRSDGRVRMIHQRSGRAPVLWIKRHNSATSLHRDQVHRLQDGSELRIIDKRIPQAIAVVNE